MDGRTKNQLNAILLPMNFPNSISNLKMNSPILFQELILFSKPKLSLYEKIIFLLALLILGCKSNLKRLNRLV
jgi:hypothetical protein